MKELPFGLGIFGVDGKCFVREVNAVLLSLDPMPTCWQIFFARSLHKMLGEQRCEAAGDKTVDAAGVRRR